MSDNTVSLVVIVESLTMKAKTPGVKAAETAVRVENTKNE